jgi:CubicO group peptidase (beta-lactamase class C family)
VESIGRLIPVVWLVLLLAACEGGAAGGGDTDTGTETETETETDEWDPRFDPFVAALLQDLAASDAYGVSAAVMEDGVVTFAAAFGSKDPDGAEPLTPDTLMQIGSTTKQLTATALLRKVEDGAVTLDATLEEVLPALEFALDGTWDDQITLHHLLSHQGGLVDFILGSVSSEDDALAGFGYGGFAQQAYLMNPPGAFWNYSNPNFALAGLVTESLDTRPWPDIVLEDVFAPLGMDRTFPRKSEVEADGDFALSYGLGLDDLATGIPGPVAMEDVPDPAFDRPAGFVWTTPTQMMRWARFLRDGDPAVLADDLRAELTAEQVDTLYGAGTMFYGYGLFVERGYWTLDGDWYELPVWEHGGNTLSFSHIFYVLPEQGFAVAICSSAYGTDFSASLDAAITTLVELPQPTPGPEYVIDPAKFDGHVGAYLDPYNVGEVIITREGDALFVGMPTLEAYGYDVEPALEVISSDIFLAYIDGEPYDITFVRAAAEGLSTYVRNRSYVATRVEAEGEGLPRPPPTRAEVERWMVRSRLEPAPPCLRQPRSPLSTARGR